MNLKCEYYHGSITRIQAEEKLRAAQTNGSFLIRDGSSIPNSYILLLLWNGTVNQYRILTSSDDRLYFEMKAPDRRKSYDSLPKLLEELISKNEKNGMCCALTKGVPCVHYETSEDDDSDYGDDADFLKSIQKDVTAAALTNTEMLPSPDRTAASVRISYENERPNQPHLIKQLRRKLALTDGSASREECDFATSVNHYLDFGFTEDMRAMQADSSRSDTLPLQHLKKLIGEEGKVVVECVSAFCRKLKVLAQLFETDQKTEQACTVPETSSTYSELLAAICQCKEMLVSTELQAVNLLTTVALQSGAQATTSAPQSGSQVTAIQEASFVVRLKAGLVTSVPYSIKVDVQSGNLCIIKSSSTSLEDLCYIPIQHVLQVIKSTDNATRLTLIARDRKKELYSFSDVRAREHFCQLVQQTKRMHTATTGIEQISIFVGSWNVGYAEPPATGLPSWLRSTGLGKTRASALSVVPHDMYVVGIQESGISDKDWALRIRRTLQTMFNVDFHTVAVCALWAIKLMVLVKPEHTNRISHVKQDTVKTGLANALGNKGAAAVSFHFEGTSFCFVNAHLTANTEKCERRNQNFRDIIQGLSNSQGNRTLADFDLTHQFHHVFWFGDLNYRVEDTITFVLERAAKEEYHLLLKSDQLIKVKRGNKAFYGFVEDPITFPPSYRYQKGTRDIFHWKKEKKTGVKINTPSWCDRVLWKSYPNLHIQNTSYGIVKDVVTSDHKPLFSSFNVGIAAIGSSQSRNDTISSMSIHMREVEVTIETTAKEQEFQLVIFSTCLEALIYSNASVHEGRSGSEPSCCIKFDNIEELRPVINDPAYVQDQHLLVGVKMAGEYNGELYGACVVPLSDVFEGYPVKFKHDLTHMGEKNGSIRGIVIGKVSGVTRAESFRRQTKSIVIFTDDDSRLQWEDAVAEETVQTAASAAHVAAAPSPHATPELTGAQASSSIEKNRVAHVRSMPDIPAAGKCRPTLSVASAEEGTGDSALPALPPRPGRSITMLDDRGGGSKDSVPSAAAADSVRQAIPSSHKAVRPPARTNVHSGGGPHTGHDSSSDALMKMPTAGSRPQKPPAALPEAAASSDTAVVSWLTSLGLKQYAQLFCEHGWNDMRFMNDITAADLSRMGLEKRHISVVLDSTLRLK